MKRKGFTPLETIKQQKKDKMSLTGFTLVEIMVGLAIIALLAACAIPSLLSARRSANEAAAKATLRNLSTALETYSISNGGSYPTNVDQLAAYIPSAPNYCGDAGPFTLVQGYVYRCYFLEGAGYVIVATPQNFGTTGNVTYSVTTGGALTPL